MLTMTAIIACGLANWIRGGLWGEQIKAALRAVHPFLEDSWRSVGDRLLTTPLVLAGAAWLSGATWWQAVIAWLLLYVGFVMGWPWIGMGRLNEDGTVAGWAAARLERGRWLAWLPELVLGHPRFVVLGQVWSFPRRWAYDATCLALRGLVITAPAGAVLLNPWFALAGLAMPIAYEIGQHMPGRWRGTGAGECIFGAWLGTMVIV